MQVQSIIELEAGSEVVLPIGQSLQVLEPVKVLYFPKVQAEQVLSDRPAYPGRQAQCMGKTEPTGDAELVGQETQNAPLLYVLAGQGLHPEPSSKPSPTKPGGQRHVMSSRGPLFGQLPVEFSIDWQILHAAQMGGLIDTR